MPADGSFRTDTPAATGLVRGTSYIVILGSAGTCGATGDQPCIASMILLTDRNGHVGRVDVTPNGSSAAVPLSRAGDAAAASNSTATAAHIDPTALANLESVAHVRSDPTAARTTEQDARAIAATLVTLAAAAATPVDGATVGSLVQPPAEAVSAPPAPAVPPTRSTGDHTDGPGHGNSGSAHPSAPAAPAPDKHADSAAPPKVAAPPHADTGTASSAPSAPNSTPASSPAPPSTSVDSRKPDTSAKAAAKAATADNSGSSNN